MKTEPDQVWETYNALPPMLLLTGQNRGEDYMGGIPYLHPNLSEAGDYSFGLRGGGDFDDEDEEDDVVDAEEEHSMDLDEPVELIPSSGNALVSLRGGGPLKDLGEVFNDIDNGKRLISTEAFRAFAQTDNHKEGLKSRLGGERSGTENLWIPLYGYQGIVWFRIDQLNTFVDAVDRLLGFGIRAGASYKLYLFDRNKEYKTRAQQEAFQRNSRNTFAVVCKGPGDYSNDQLAWNWVISHLGSLGEDSNGSPVAHQKVLFVAGPADPVPYEGWEPTDQHNVAKLVLEWDGLPDMNRPDVAYLRMPLSEDPTEVDIHTNEYNPWIAQACRILCAGRIPNRPGYPYVPDAYINLKDEEGANYGGLTFDYDSWTRILKTYKYSRNGPIVLQAQTSESPGGHIDRWHMFVPGVSYVYDQGVTLLHSELSDTNTVLTKISDMIEIGIGPEQMKDLSTIEVHMPGEDYLVDGRLQSELAISVDAKGKLDWVDVNEVSNLCGQWYEWLKEKAGVSPAKNGLDMYPQFITLQPVFREYFLICDEDNERMIDWNPRETSLDEFRDLIAELWTPGKFSVDYDPETFSVRLSQNALGGAPMLVVKPTTTEMEWYHIRDMIIWPDLVVQVFEDPTECECFCRNCDGEGFANILTVFGDDIAQPFGYRDIYQTDNTILFGSLHDPDQVLADTNTLRYCRDYQLWGEEVPWSQGQLKTLKPEDRQPQPTAGATGASQQSRAITGPEPAIDANPLGFAGNLPPPTTKHTGIFAASRKLDLNAMDPNEKGRFLREFSYANPLTVDFVKGIPVHKPPIDQLLDTKFDSVPRLANSVLTPSETRHLQQKFSEVRSIMLDRMEKCQFPGCDAAFPYKDRHTLMARHIKDAHMTEKCNFCGDPLFAHWTVGQRFQHFASKHSDILGGLATTRPIDPNQTNSDHPNPFQFQRELTWGFCSRCGRDHSVLASKLDRFHHDLVCYPGAAHHEVHPWRACQVCGDRIHPDDRASVEAHRHPDVARGIENGWRPSYCGQCGLSLRKIDNVDREKHAHFCRGHCSDVKGHNSASFNVRFCPWCGIEMAMHTAADGSQQIDLMEAQRHIDSCVSKPEDDKKVFVPLHAASHLPYYYGIPKGAKTARVDIPEGVIALQQWVGPDAAAADGILGGTRKPLKARKGEMVGPKGATDLTYKPTPGSSAKAGEEGPGPATAASNAAAAARAAWARKGTSLKKTVGFADPVEEEQPEEDDEDGSGIGSDLSILSSEEEREAKAAKKAGKR